MDLHTDEGFNTFPNRIDHAELFFKSAKFLLDSSSGFEDGDLWSVQALSLMTIYQIMVSRWNAAYALIGEKYKHRPSRVQF